jgi:hypothetical protein
MKRSFIELTFYETYNFANIVKDVLEHPDEYYNLNDFYGEDRCLSYISPFPRFSAFHRRVERRDQHSVALIRVQLEEANGEAYYLESL